jgi:threonine/homoserine/homoserine lactone efflux protein
VDALMLGVTVGAAAGISPGPLLILVISQTLRSGWRAGLATAAAPLLSDAVVIAGTVLVLDQLPAWALPLIGVVGAGYIIWMGIEGWRTAHPVTLAGGGVAVPIRAAVRRAALVNLLSPHPWLTWAAVLGPLTLSTWRSSPAGAAALVLGFYIALVGAKAAIAVLVAGGRSALTPRVYLLVMRIASLALVVAGVALLAEFGPQALRGIAGS